MDSSDRAQQCFLKLWPSSFEAEVKSQPHNFLQQFDKVVLSRVSSWAASHLAAICVNCFEMSFEFLHLILCASERSKDKEISWAGIQCHCTWWMPNRASLILLARLSWIEPSQVTEIPMEWIILSTYFQEPVPDSCGGWGIWIAKESGRTQKEYLGKGNGKTRWSYYPDEFLLQLSKCVCILT